MRRPDFLRGLAPQPRLIWAAGIGAGLVALAVVSPLLGFVAVVYNAGLAAIAARDLALLPGRSGYRARRVMPEPFSLGEPEEVTLIIENHAAAGLMARGWRRRSALILVRSWLRQPFSTADRT